LQIRHCKRLRLQLAAVGWLRRARQDARRKFEHLMLDTMQENRLIVTSVASIGVGDKGTPSLVTPPTPSAVSNDPIALLGDPYIPHPGPNFDTTNFGPPTIDPKSLT
jgi:hypothetical protein